MRKTLVLIVLCLAGTLHAQKFKGLALTPPMGWNSWNKFGCNVNEELIRETADAMVRSGMKDAGYVYINIDDCWHGQRDEQGFIQADPQRFPSGMKALADYIHSKGLKFGVYSDAGWQTCAGKPGSRGHEYQDAMKYAEWGVDYLKYDWCNTDGLKTEGAYLTMRDALFAAGRPIVFSLCEWGSSKPWTWAKNVGHLWRTTGDITAIFDGVEDHGTWKSLGIMKIVDLQDGLREYAGPDHWNDPDMMEVGNGMSVNEDRAHFSMWCMLAAPLIAGNDLRNMSAETVAILTNPGAIAVNQDPLGIQGFKYEAEQGLETWFKPLVKGQWAVCFVNRSMEARDVRFVWKDHPIADDFSDRKIDFAKMPCRIVDIWSDQNRGRTDEALEATVPAHDVLMVRLEPLNAPKEEPIAKVKDLVGRWDIVTTRGETKTYYPITLAQADDGALAIDWPGSRISAVQFQNNQLLFVRSLTFGDREMSSHYSATLRNGAFVGEVSTDRGESPVRIARVVPTSPAMGTWNMQYRVGDREMTGQLLISQDPDGTLTGQWIAERGEHAISDVQCKGKRLTFRRKSTYDNFEFEIDFTGTIEGDTLTGQFTSQRGDVQANGKRKGAGFVGVWDLEMETQFGPPTRRLVIRPDLTVRYQLFDGLIEARDVTIDGNRLHFVLVTRWGNRTSTMNFTATLQDGILKGELVSERGETPFVGRKVSGPGL